MLCRPNENVSKQTMVTSREKRFNSCVMKYICFAIAMKTNFKKMCILKFVSSQSD